MKQLLRNDWWTLLMSEFNAPYFRKLHDFLRNGYQNQEVYPDVNLIYNAFNITSYKNTRVVILGQDPYHGPGQAHGLSFSVPPGIAVPRSLRNIYKELAEDCGCSAPDHGCLISWAEQGVLLLNTILTVKPGQAKSHAKKGWETFTDRVLELLNEHPEPLLFMLWGNDARSKKQLITDSRHLVLEAAHPSPLSASRGFLGCRHFSRANRFLQESGRQPIDWCL